MEAASARLWSTDRALCPALPRLENSTVKKAKGDPKKPKARFLLMPSLCRHAERDIRRKTQRSLSILLNFPRNALRGGRLCLGKRSLNSMKWQRRIKCPVIGK